MRRITPLLILLALACFAFWLGKINADLDRKADELSEVSAKVDERLNERLKAAEMRLDGLNRKASKK